MTRLTWDSPDEKLFTTGVDRGVLYTQDGAAHPWVGLVSVSENISGGDIDPYYYDGIRYLNLTILEEFGLTIEALSAPEAFNRCDGMQEIANGLFVTQQNRESFGMSYRTLIGNAVEGSDYSYLIHLVYNATAAPSVRTHMTLSDTPEPMRLSWDVQTIPQLVSLHKPSAHVILDPRKLPKSYFQQLEGILYGTEISEGRLPSIQELMDMSEAYFILRTNYMENPSLETAIDGFNLVLSGIPTPLPWTLERIVHPTAYGDYVLRVLTTDVVSGVAFFYDPNLNPVMHSKLLTGSKILSFFFETNEDDYDVRVVYQFVVGNTIQGAMTHLGMIPSGERVTTVLPTPPGATKLTRVQFIINHGTTYFTAGSEFFLDGFFLGDSGEYFDGNTPPTSNAYCVWADTPELSISRMMRAINE